METKAKTRISSIIIALNRVSDAYLTYEKDRKGFLANYTGGTLQDHVAQAEAEARAAIKVPINTMKDAFDSLIEMTEQGNDYDPSSSAVADAAKLLSVPGLSFDTADKVISKFKGNQVALDLINASAHESYKDFIDKWMFDNIGLLNKGRSAAASLDYQSIGSFPSIVSKILEIVKEYARYQGIELGSISDSIEEMRLRNITALMGIEYDKI